MFRKSHSSVSSKASAHGFLSSCFSSSVTQILNHMLRFFGCLKKKRLATFQQNFDEISPVSQVPECVYVPCFSCVLLVSLLVFCYVPTLLADHYNTGAGHQEGWRGGIKLLTGNFRTKIPSLLIAFTAWTELSIW